MLPNEEYIEQAFFFEAFIAALEDGVSTQEFLSAIRNELLTTTQLRLAVDFLLTDMKLTGVLSSAMFRIDHYFTPYQAFVMGESEREDGRLDFRVALQILAKEAKYRSEQPGVQGLFFYQLETICRNRLGYDRGLDILSQDTLYNDDWKEWLKILRRQIGLVDLSDLIFYRSEYYQTLHCHSHDPNLPKSDAEPAVAVLFGEREGRIAYATRRRDSMQLFSALSRHLGYPSVPRQKRAAEDENLVPLLLRRIEHLENRLQLLEEDNRGGVNLAKYTHEG